MNKLHSAFRVEVSNEFYIYGIDAQKLALRCLEFKPILILTMSSHEDLKEAT